MKKINKILISILVVMSLICNFSNATDYRDPMQIYTINNNRIGNAAAYVAGYFVWAGIAIAVVMLMYKGIKYITGAPDGKAKIKDEIVPWFIGLVLLSSMQVAIQFVVNFAQDAQDIILTH